MLATTLRRIWAHGGLLSWLLRPVAWAFGALAGLRRRLYRGGWLATERLPVTVVVVGNVVAGGAGKTPVVMAVVEHLKAAGLPCGVISRGYGRDSRDCREVTPRSHAAKVGDEPLLIATRCRVPVFVARRRAQAARALLARHPQVRVLISDDGLQHLALGRDVDICVFDQLGIGNGRLLPAGPLREPWPRPVDLVLRPHGTPIAGFGLERRLAGHAVRADGSRRTLAQLATQPLVAVAGIAHPETFFEMLRQQGLRLARTIALPDHHALDAQALPLPEAACIVCTEKDAVKLWRHHPRAWAVPLALDIEAGFWRAFDQLLDAKLSSSDGLQTA